MITGPVQAQVDPPLEPVKEPLIADLYFTLGGDYTTQRDLELNLKGNKPASISYTGTAKTFDQSGDEIEGSRLNGAARLGFESLSIAQDNLDLFGISGAAGIHFSSGFMAEVEIGIGSRELEALYSPKGVTSANHSSFKDGRKSDPCAEFDADADCKALLNKKYSDVVKTMVRGRTVAERMREGRYSESSAIASFGFRGGKYETLKPFFLLGLGAHFQRLQLERATIARTFTENSDLPDDKTERRVHNYSITLPRSSESNTSFGYQLKAGTELEFSPAFSGVVAARYRGAIGGGDDFDTSGGGGGFSFTAGLQVKF